MTPARVPRRPKAVQRPYAAPANPLRDGRSNVLILGSAEAGKTVYAVQFYERALHGGALSATTAAEDEMMIAHARERLQLGRKPVRTKSEDKRTLLLDVTNARKKTLQLRWPDYAGEDFASILRRRVLPADWQPQVQAASGVILMIRPEVERPSPNVLQRAVLADEATSTSQVNASPPDHTQSPLAAEVASTSQNDAPPPDQAQSAPEPPTRQRAELQPDAAYVEFLQVLRYARGEGRRTQADWPLLVLLSCWDEVQAPGSPNDLFRTRYPLLFAYVQSTWPEQLRCVYGLAALGQPLTDGDNPGVQDRPLAEQGWYVDADGRHTDLTIPVAWLMDHIRAP